MENTMAETATITCPDCFGLRTKEIYEAMKPEHPNKEGFQLCDTCKGEGGVEISMEVFPLLQEILNTSNNVARGCLQVAVTAGMLYHDEEANPEELLEALKTLQSCYQATEDVRHQMIMASSLEDDAEDQEG